ncbi:ankyrin repeat domain-containing protein [Halorhodospira halochloris]|uniref:ankyrin repeat domain-containing protein n=1 Tax=Halorhodospira halochloris TaxID=1052 RepID=UPI001EE89577|nr:ankyrin repeat domain-containing protein [Halorhodospira halochloris]MCG5530652.1 ankyrin repeat domain-containing protein [Halorhodospira halochloris]
MRIGKVCRASLLGWGLGLLLASSAALANPQEELVHAAIDGGPDDIAAAVENGADVNEPHEGGWTALMIAAELNDADVVKKLIDEGADVSVQREASGFSALMIAAEHNDAEVVQALLDAGADTEMRDNEDWTALMLAAAWNDPEVVEVLLDGGADIDARSDGGGTALIFAARNNNAAMVEALIEGGADVNARNEWGFTSLMAASYANEPGVVSSLIEAGADPTLTDRHDQTAADWGRRNSRVHDTQVYYAMRDAEEEAQEE